MSDNPMKKNVAVMGVFLSVALILSYVESLVPFYFGVPGMKLGLTNVMVVLLLYYRSPKEAFTISLLRILLSSLLFGSLFSFCFSLAGGLFSFFVMWIVFRLFRLHPVTVSILGGVSHNVGQLVAAMLLVKNYAAAFYFPVLFFFGIVTGGLIGIMAAECGKRLPFLQNGSKHKNCS